MPFGLQSVLKIAGVRTTAKSHSFYLMRLHEHRGMPAEAVAQLEKAAALSPELNPMALLLHACAISRPEREGSEDSEPARTQAKKKAAFPVISLP
jgi:hypothetical protein